MLPLFSLPSEISASRGSIPEGRELTASRTAASRSVERPSLPEVRRSFHGFWPSVKSARRVERAKGTTRSALLPRASSRSETTFDARSRSRCVTLADVSTSTPTATFAVEMLKRGCANASRIRVKVAIFSASPSLRGVRWYSKYPQARGIQASASTHARSKVMTLSSGASAPPDSAMRPAA